MSRTSYADQLQALAQQFKVTGASFAYWDGAELHLAATGLRNSVTGDPVTTDTVMHIGSIMKVINAALFMQLVDDGLVGLDDLVTQHLPHFRLKDRDALARLTCRMLLNHTSGINGDFLPDQGPDRERLVDLIERCADLDQIHAPGDGASYCNVAPCIAGFIAEKLRGRSWYTLVKERIFEPLGMHHALVDVGEAPRFRVSVGDVLDREAGRYVQTPRPFPPLSFAPCGATAMMSAADLVSFGRAMLKGGVGSNGARVLSQKSVEAMTAQPVEVPGQKTRYGIGWGLRPGDVLSHSGGGLGTFATFLAHPPSGKVVALLTNCEGGMALMPAFIEPLVQSWTGLPPAAPTKPIAMPADLHPYVGVFGNNAVRMHFSVSDGVLAVQTRMVATVAGGAENSAPQQSLTAVGPDAFELPTHAALGSMVFTHPDASGRMTRLNFAARMLPRLA
jgi:CubicO group peptidase (beta-lactamase class C family)